MNRVILLGRIGQEPELKTTQAGQPVLKFSLATSERYKDRDGSWKDRTEWHRVVVWGKRGEALWQILHKGSQVLVEGSLKTTTSEKDGRKTYYTEVIANDVTLCGSKKDAAPAAPQGGFTTAFGEAKPFVDDQVEDSIPF